MPAVEPALRWADIAERTGRKIHPRVQFDSAHRCTAEADRAYEAKIGTLGPGAIPGTLRSSWKPVPRRRSTAGSASGMATATYMAVRPSSSSTPGTLSPPVRRRSRRHSRSGRYHTGKDRVVPLPGARLLPIVEGRAFEAGNTSSPRRGDLPNIIWPDDRAWCVATEIDLDSTYLGGSMELIEAVLATIASRRHGKPRRSHRYDRGHDQRASGVSGLTALFVHSATDRGSASPQKTTNSHPQDETDERAHERGAD